MGQAAIDLPDPLERTRPDAASAPAADDLLSQMAGDEIERMLGAAGVEPPTPAAATSAPVPAAGARHSDPTPPVVPAADAPARDLNADLLPDADELPVSTATSKASTAAKPDEDPALQAQLDALFDQINASPSAPAPAADTAPPAAAIPSAPPPETTEAPPTSPESVTPDPAPPALSTDPLSAVFNQIEASDARSANPAAATSGGPAPVEDARSTEAAEQDLEDALEPPDAPPEAEPSAAPAATAEPSAAAPVPGTVAAEASTAAPVPETETPAQPAGAALFERPSLLVRVLEVLNSPFSFLSDTVRDALGKVAILTLINAIAVLIYVLFFRRH